MDSDFYPTSLDDAWDDETTELTDKCRYCGASIVNSDAHSCYMDGPSTESAPNLVDLRRSLRKMLGH